VLIRYQSILFKRIATNAGTDCNGIYLASNLEQTTQCFECCICSCAEAPINHNGFRTASIAMRTLGRNWPVDDAHCLHEYPCQCTRIAFACNLEGHQVWPVIALQAETSAQIALHVCCQCTQQRRVNLFLVVYIF